MKNAFKIFSFLFLICCLTTTSFGQDRTVPNLALRIAGGNNISTFNFFTDDLSYNIPTTGYISVGLSTNVRERNGRSVFIGADLQVFNYYPAVNVKNNLGYVSLLVGRTRRFDFLPSLIYLKYTNGLSINSLLEASSSNPNSPFYYSNPFKNLNVGFFNNLQVLFAGENRRNRNFDYGLGIDFGYRGIQIFRDRFYPSYLTNNYFLQYGLNLNMNYHF